MTRKQAIRQLDDFFLGAAMQTSPGFDDFGGMDEPPDPPPKPKPRPKATAYPMPDLTFADYLKIHCGNTAAAYYWYKRNNPDG